MTPEMKEKRNSMAVAFIQEKCEVQDTVTAHKESFFAGFDACHEIMKWDMDKLVRDYVDAVSGIEYHKHAREIETLKSEITSLRNWKASKDIYCDQLEKDLRREFNYAETTKYELNLAKDKLERITREKMESVVSVWRLYWMGQIQNSEEDRQNYYQRASRIDANMRHHLAKMIYDFINGEKLP